MRHSPLPVRSVICASHLLLLTLVIACSDGSSRRGSGSSTSVATALTLPQGGPPWYGTGPDVDTTKVWTDTGTGPWENTSVTVPPNQTKCGPGVYQTYGAVVVTEDPRTTTIRVDTLECIKSGTNCSPLTIDSFAVWNAATNPLAHPGGACPQYDTGDSDDTSIVRLQNGDLLFSRGIRRHRCHGSNTPGPVGDGMFVFLRSSDCGQTWQPAGNIDPFERRAELGIVLPNTARRQRHWTGSWRDVSKSIGQIGSITRSWLAIHKCPIST